MKNMNNKPMWKGNDVSLSVCIEDYGMVYEYDGENFNGYVADSYDENNVPNSFAPFWMDNQSIDDYFADNGEEFAKMCGAKVEDMNYEWKMDALMAYYGSYEFISGMYKPISKDELVEIVKDNWQGIMDM